MSHLFSSYNSPISSSSSSSLVQLLDPLLLSQAMPLTNATLLPTTNTPTTAIGTNNTTSTVASTTIHQNQPLRRSARRLTQRLPSATAVSSSSPLSSPMSEESGSPLSPLPSSSATTNNGGDDCSLLSTGNMSSHDLAKMIANAPQPNKQGKYECIVCHRAYTHKKHLRRHSMRHTGQKPYPCRYCYLRYMRCDTRNRHESTCKVKRALDHEEAEKRKNSVPSREIKTEPEDPVVQFIAEDTISSFNNHQQHQRPLVESPLVELLPPTPHNVLLSSSNFYFTSFNDKQHLVQSLPAHDDIINGALFDDANYSLSLDSVYPFETYQQPDYDSFFN